MTLLPLVVLHICAGSIALLSGFVAIALRKGSRRHSVAGRAFASAMLVMSTSGACIAFVRSQQVNVLMGVLTFYLVATAWATAKRKPGQSGPFDRGALLVGLAAGTSLLYYGFQAANSLSGKVHEFPARFYFVFGAVALVAVAGDGRLILQGGVFGKYRIARHLWRMCIALFIAATSFFVGQQKVFPPYLRGSKLWSVPPLLALLVLIFWLVRLVFTKRWKVVSHGVDRPRAA